MRLHHLLAGLCAGALLMTSQPAMSQMDNRPFQFRQSGGLGMSTGGRQAILQEKLRNQRPDNLVRRNGVLVDVVEGPGGAAIVQNQGAAFVPNARRGGFRADGAAVGVFNPFFRNGGGGSSGASPAIPAMYHSSTALTGWTHAVASESHMPSVASNATSSVIAAWTQQVYLLR